MSEEHKSLVTFCIDELMSTKVDTSTLKVRHMVYPRTKRRSPLLLLSAAAADVRGFARAGMRYRWLRKAQWTSCGYASPSCTRSI